MKSPLLRLLIVVLASTCSTLADDSAPELNGAWRIDQPKAFGVTLHTFLILHEHAGKIDGRVFPNGAVDLPLRDAHMEGPETVFRMAWGWTLHVRPEGPNLRVRFTYGDGKSQDSIGYPIQEAEMHAPVAPAVEALRNLADNGLARTPPMGWNSWNHFAEAVDDKIVRETADAMVTSGMAAAGYAYINIDDTWEGSRDSEGNIIPNRKFPDMKALADYVHSKGLKLGIYSSPGPLTCGGYEGSLGHEEQDARTYARWGVDYLKYDWCSAGRIYTHADLQPVYQKMGEALQRCGRPIIYSLCEYGGAEVWSWGAKVGGNLWRTTGDIQDNWKSMTEIGFNQGRLASFASPGHWNDPDMLEIGNGGMSSTEYKTHFSLWCMLAAPLMAGNDLRNMSAETREILTNLEVIAVDQDILGKQGHRLFENSGIEVWSKPLSGGGQALGVFNRNADARPVAFSWNQTGGPLHPASVRDLWEHREREPADGFNGQVAGHGVVLLRVR